MIHLAWKWWKTFLYNVTTTKKVYPIQQIDTQHYSYLQYFTQIENAYTYKII